MQSGKKLCRQLTLEFHTRPDGCWGVGVQPCEWELVVGNLSTNARVPLCAGGFACTHPGFACTRPGLSHTDPS